MKSHLFEIIFNKSRQKDLAYYYMQHAHSDQKEGYKRKGTGKPYWTHPEQVCEILEDSGVEDEICAAALLHDTIEDSGVSKEDIIVSFGERVARLVKEVTNTPDLNGLKKEDYMNKKLLTLSSDALYIKLADMCANAMDKPRPEQLERMNNNIKFLVSNRDDLDDIQQQLIKKFKKAYDNFLS